MSVDHRGPLPDRKPSCGNWRILQIPWSGTCQRNIRRSQHPRTRRNCCQTWILQENSNRRWATFQQYVWWSGINPYLFLQHNQFGEGGIPPMFWDFQITDFRFLGQFSFEINISLFFYFSRIFIWNRHQKVKRQKAEFLQIWPWMKYCFLLLKKVIFECSDFHYFRSTTPP